MSARAGNLARGGDSRLIVCRESFDHGANAQTRLHKYSCGTAEFERRHSMKYWSSLLEGFCTKPRRRRGHWPYRVETFEARLVLNAVWPGLVEAVPNDTLDMADGLGQLTGNQSLSTSGAIGDAVTGTRDVDWYRFELARPSLVTLSTRTAPDAMTTPLVLSLYNHSPYSFEDIQNPLGHRQLVQMESPDQTSPAVLDRVLGAGTYFVVVSGAGNRAFHPFLAGSGIPGATGEYLLTISAQELAVDADVGLSVLTTEPAAEASLDSSPFTIRIQLNGQLDPATIAPDDTVHVTWSSNTDFTDGDELPVPLATYGYNAFAGELEVTPAMPLAPGYYRVLLAGNHEQRLTVLRDLNGEPLGRSDLFPQGQDFAFKFRIAGTEGAGGAAAAANDTPAGAHELGDVTHAGLVQVAGAIGDDPYDNPTIDSLLNPANDVDLYHFVIGGNEHYAFAAEIFAGRIGSPLDPGISLYRLDPSNGSLVFVAGNNNTFNPALATNGTLPLYTDSAVFAGVTAGEYYVAVSSAFNTPSVAEGLLPGSEGLFDPNFSHSGKSGINTGRYVLNLRLDVDATAPRVLASSPAVNDVLTTAPTSLSVTFGEPVNLLHLAFHAFQQSGDTTLTSVFITAADGTRFYPRLLSYDAATGVAEFLMLDGLPTGTYAWHLSGALELTDLADNPLEGNDPGGDYVVTFAVDAPARGVNADPLQRSVEGTSDDLTNPQDLSVLFPHELQAVVSVTRDPANHTDAGDISNFLRFEVLQHQDYVFILNGDALPDGVQLTLSDTDGSAVPSGRSDNGRIVTASLPAGTYVARISGWSSADAAGLLYELRMALIAVYDNPPPLTTGAAPALQLRLSGTVSLSPQTAPQFAFSSGVPGNSTASTTPISSASPVSFVTLGKQLIGTVGATPGVPSIVMTDRLTLRLPDLSPRHDSQVIAMLNWSRDARNDERHILISSSRDITMWNWSRPCDEAESTEESVVSDPAQTGERPATPSDQVSTPESMEDGPTEEPVSDDIPAPAETAVPNGDPSVSQSKTTKVVRDARSTPTRMSPSTPANKGRQKTSQINEQSPDDGESAAYFAWVGFVPLAGVFLVADRKALCGKLLGPYQCEPS